MDTPFIYDKYVTGKNFIGRKKECTAMANLLSSNENLVLLGTPKSGTMSAIQQTFFNMKMAGKHFATCNVNLFNVRSLSAMLLKFGNAVIRALATTADEYEYIVETHLAGTHFVFDQKRFCDFDEAVSLNWDADANDIFFMLRLPARIAAARGMKIYMVIDEFQTVAELEDNGQILRSFKEVLSERRNDGSGCNFVITGSCYNAMRAIFHKSPMFRGVIEEFTIPSAEEAEIVDYMVKGLLQSGKVIEKDAAARVAHMFEGNLWYINHFVSICDSLTKGYITNAIMMDSLNTLVSIHDVRFRTSMNNLTWHQISFLQAMLEGVTRFTAADVIRKYKLNSSANVVRVKEALMKKELITFTDNDEAVFLDPLFKYWLTNYYFV
ncbi:MAG: hypothetical protein MJY72_04445 [Bacteroidales bacterium]|nr:hypothetical protein [Bacteroidales bacterium]